MITFDAIKPKVIRILIAATVFMGLISYPGIDARVSQEMILWCLGIGIFALIIRNIWISLFMLWSVSLFIFFHMNTGGVYLTNIFTGALLYHIASTVYAKKHVKFYLDTLLWFTVINIAFMIVQAVKLDYVFTSYYYNDAGETIYQQVHNFSGFMFYESAMAMLCVVAQAILLARGNFVSRLAGVMLVIPIYLTKSSMCLIASAILILYNIWENYGITIGGITLKRSLIVAVSIPIMLTGILYYAMFKDNPTSSIRLRANQYAMVFRDAWVHPITGWGLDSYRRNDLPWKNFTYSTNFQEKVVNGKVVKSMDTFDNAHNLYLQLFYEWGIFGLGILMGFLRQMYKWYQAAYKSEEVRGLAGIIMAGCIMSMAHFPMFVSRLAIIFIIASAMFEVVTRQERTV